MLQKKDLVSHIQEQLEEWESRVFYPNVAFKENTPADLEALKKKVIDSNIKDQMLIISSETFGCVYKIGRFLVEAGVKNKDITFIDGDLLMPYVDTEARYRYQARNLIDEGIENIARDISRKWVIIPEINFEWDKELVLYFISKIEKLRPYGILFYSNPNADSNLAQVLVEQTNTDVYQFPKGRYEHKRQRELPPDDY